MSNLTKEQKTAIKVFIPIVVFGILCFIGLCINRNVERFR